VEALPSSGGFANVWQNRAEFAKHWQVHPPRGFRVLPILGKITRNLPSLGKMPDGVGYGMR
jgi:hypothetical protein